MTVLPPLPPQVRRSLELLRTEGVEVTAEEGAWLAELWRRATDPCAGFSPFLPGAPVVIGSLVLWPLHALALDWWVRIADLLPDQSTDAYIFAHTRSKPFDDSLLMLTNPAAASAAVGEWRVKLALHDAVIPDLMHMLRMLNGDDMAVEATPDEPKQESVPNPLANICALYCQLFPSTTPEYWKTGISAAESKALLAAKTDEPEWNKSERMHQAEVNYLRAVKWLRMKAVTNG